MRMPFLNRIAKRVNTIGQFGGLNQGLVIADGEFSAMKNMSCDDFPAISTRKNRGAVLKTLTKPNGLYYKNGLFYVDGTKAYYDGTEKFSVTDSKKTLVGIGAYICVFPDKILFNTADGTHKSMEASFSGASVSVEPLSPDSSFAKITATGIGNAFSVYDAVELSGFTGDLAELNGQVKIINEIDTNYIVVSYVTEGTKTQASGAVFRRNVPDMDFVCECDNRLWGCSSSKHEVYSSKLGDPTNWYSFEGISTDSYAATVGSDGDFTGCIVHMGYVLFFKENTIHTLYGNKPNNYQLNASELPGAIYSDSMAIINETLYYVGRNGVYAYNGATPEKISEKIKETITDANCCYQDDKLYVSCKLDGVQTILVYDTKNGIWDAENDETFDFSAYGDGVLYYIDGGKLSTIKGSRSETIDFYIESGDVVESSIDEKYISKFKLNIMLQGNLVVYIKYDDGEWKRAGSIISPRKTTYNFPIIPQRCNKYRWKIEGTGDFKLLGVSREVEGGTESDGRVHA